MSKPAVMWPFTKTSAVKVDREWAGTMLAFTRRHAGRIEGYKLWAYYRAANNRPFTWPVRGATQ